MAAGLEFFIVDFAQNRLHVEFETIRGLCHDFEGILKKTKWEFLSGSWGVGGEPETEIFVNNSIWVSELSDSRFEFEDEIE